MGKEKRPMGRRTSIYLSAEAVEALGWMEGRAGGFGLGPAVSSWVVAEAERRGRTRSGPRVETLIRTLAGLERDLCIAGGSVPALQRIRRVLDEVESLGACRCGGLVHDGEVRHFAGCPHLVGAGRRQ